MNFQPIPCPELDNSGVIEPDAGEALPMGEAGKEVSEDDLDKANDERDKATAAFSDGTQICWNLTFIGEKSKENIVFNF